VGVILIHAVHGVAGGKHGLAAGLHIGGRMGEEAGITVFVIGVERKVAPRLDLRLGGKAGADDVAAPGKAFGAVGDGLLAERNVEVDLPLDDIDERRGHRVLKLDHDILPGCADLQCHAVPRLVGVHVHKADLLRTGRGHEGLALGVKDL